MSLRAKGRRRKDLCVINWTISTSGDFNAWTTHTWSRAEGGLDVALQGRAGSTAKKRRKKTL
jgi:hypothetical protein